MNTTLQTEWARTAFAAWEREMNGESKSGIHRLRREALEAFTRAGYPTGKQEEWRFTNVLPIAATEFTPSLRPDAAGVTVDAIERTAGGGWARNRHVFVNGHYAPPLSRSGSLPEGVRVRSIAETLKNSPEALLSVLGKQALPSDNSFTAMNGAFLQDGAFITLAGGVDAGETIHLIFLATESATPFLQTPRILIVAGDRSRCSVVASYHSAGSGIHLTAAVTELEIGAGAAVEFDTIQDERASAFHVGATHIVQKRESAFRGTTVALGASIVRNNVTARFDGEGSECTINGLSIGTGRQLIDNHTTIDHASPGCTSHELYKAILDGSARGVFNGKIFVRKDAQKTDAKQTNRTLLLSDQATMDTKPQLEIFADDVKCTHGATIGQLEDEHLFYLRSRGIGLEAARDMLTFAFAGDVINRMQVAPVREMLDHKLHARLRAGRIADN